MSEALNWEGRACAYPREHIEGLYNALVEQNISALKALWQHHRPYAIAHGLQEPDWQAMGRPAPEPARAVPDQYEPEVIAERLSTATGIPLDEICGKEAFRSVLLARWALVLLLAKYTSLSFTDIGAFVGRSRDAVRAAMAGYRNNRSAVEQIMEAVEARF